MSTNDRQLLESIDAALYRIEEGQYGKCIHCGEPILEKRLGRYQLDFNPVIGRALRGPGRHEGWDFEPAARVAYEWNSRIDLSLEYYGALGPLGNLLPGHEQVHQFYPGADIKLSESVVWNVGVGVAATETGNQLVYKTRIGILFGRKHH